MKQAQCLELCDFIKNVIELIPSQISIFKTFWETMFMQHEKLGQAAMSIVSDNYTNCHCQMQKIKEVIFMHYWWNTEGKGTEPYGAEGVAGIVAKLQSYSSSAF